MVRAKHTIYVLHRRMLTRGCPTLSGVGKGWGFLLFMPRRLKRYHGRGDLHFITFSCYERRSLLGTVRARNLFLKILEEVRRGCVASMVGYVVMPEHVHLLLSEPKKGTLAKLLQLLKQRVSRAMRGRKRRRVSGQLSLAFPEPLAGLLRCWQRRYYDFNVYSAQKIREKLDYIHTNPVQRRLVKHPQDWPSSSWSFYASGEQGVVKIEPTGEERRSEEGPPFANTPQRVGHPRYVGCGRVCQSRCSLACRSRKKTKAAPPACFRRYFLQRNRDR